MGCIDRYRSVNTRCSSDAHPIWWCVAVGTPSAASRRYPTQTALAASPGPCLPTTTQRGPPPGPASSRPAPTNRWGRPTCPSCGLRSPSPALFPAPRQDGDAVHSARLRHPSRNGTCAASRRRNSRSWVARQRLISASSATSSSSSSSTISALVVFNMTPSMKGRCDTFLCCRELVADHPLRHTSVPVVVSPTPCHMPSRLPSDINTQVPNPANGPAYSA